MVARSTKSVKNVKAKEKKEKEQRNFSLDEVKLLLANVNQMTVEQLAELLDASESEILDLIKQFNQPNQSITRNSFIVGSKTGRPHMNGVVVGTQASSELSDKVMGAGQGLQPKQVQDGIFYQPEKK